MRRRKIRRWTSDRSRTQKKVDERRLKQHLAHRLNSRCVCEKVQKLSYFMRNEEHMTETNSPLWRQIESSC